MALQRRRIEYQPSQENQAILQLTLCLYEARPKYGGSGVILTLSGMVRGARAVFQFYPENPQQMELLTSSAIQVRSMQPTQKHSLQVLGRVYRRCSRGLPKLCESEKVRNTRDFYLHITFLRDLPMALC